MLPADPSALNVVWRMAPTGAGFGLFQTPNNPHHDRRRPTRALGWGERDATARLLGQTTGAALVARSDQDESPSRSRFLIERNLRDKKRPAFVTMKSRFTPFRIILYVWVATQPDDSFAST